MGVLRQENWLGQQRVDVPYLRAVESAVAADFDALGQSVVSSMPYIVTGFNIPVVPSPVGLPATQLLLNTANGVALHSTASESGTIFTVPSNRPQEILNSATNTNVVGNFSANQTNYVGIDLIRSSDSSTSDQVQFLPANAGVSNAPVSEISKVVPLARTLNYRIVIQNQTFSSTSNIAPVAIVATDINNNVVSVEDARQLLLRLGSGSDTPNVYNKYSWSSGRSENPITFSTGSTQDPFAGGDKQLGSLKNWMDAVMTRLQEIGGGQYWYSPTQNLNIKMLRIGTTFADGDNFQVSGATSVSCTLAWQGLYVAFDSLTATDTGGPPTYTNKVQITDNPSGSTIYPGQCLYVDVDRSTTTFTALTAQIGNLDSLNVPSPPFSRFVMAWAEVSGANTVQVFTRDATFQVGLSSSIATTTAFGTVELNAPQNSGSATVASIDTNGNVIGQGLSRGAASVTGVGAGILKIGGLAFDQGMSIDVATGGYQLNIGNTNLASGILIGVLNNTPVQIGNFGAQTEITGAPILARGTPSSTVPILQFIGQAEATGPHVDVGSSDGTKTLNVGTGNATAVNIGPITSSVPALQLTTVNQTITANSAIILNGGSIVQMNSNSFGKLVVASGANSEGQIQVGGFTGHNTHLIDSNVPLMTAATSGTAAGTIVANQTFNSGCTVSLTRCSDLSGIINFQFSGSSVPSIPAASGGIPGSATLFTIYWNESYAAAPKVLLTMNNPPSSASGQLGLFWGPAPALASCPVIVYNTTTSAITLTEGSLVTFSYMVIY